MLNRFRNFFQRILLSKNLRLDLNTLAGHAPKAESTLRTRILWLIELLQWIRLEGSSSAHQFDFSSGTPQAVRVKYLLQVLDRNPEWKDKVSLCLSSILRDTHATELFMNAGISESGSLLGEFTDRLLRKFLPQAPNDHDLTTLFSEYLKDPKDVAWISSLDSETFEKLLALFNDQQLLHDAKEAMILLAIQIRGAGMSSVIRARLGEKNFTKLPFYAVPGTVESLIGEQDHEIQIAISNKLERLIEDCFISLAEVTHHLDEYGVNLGIVFLIDKLESQLTRLKDLSSLVIKSSKDTHHIANFITQLIAQNSRRHSLGALVSDNFSLISRKIAERSAETGEHYISRNLEEYKHIYQSALGGGLITTLTTILKYGIYFLQLPILLTGLSASINYAISFLAIHFAGFTLGTKQPAMTAPVLAAKMHRIRDEAALEVLVDEIVHLVRTQSLAVFGNVIATAPTTFFLCTIYLYATNSFFLSTDRALHTLQSFSILGMTPFYAALTGILLWISSVVAGWFDNWFAYRRLASALSHNRRIIFIFGEKRARILGVFLKKNISGIAANVSLGFLLGLTPVLGEFLALPLDVRHVTLSSASLGAALVSLPTSIYSSATLWLAIFGIISMAFLNITVCFSMAMFVAIRARNVHAPERNLIYRAVWKRIKQKPLSFVFPPKDTPHST